MSNGDKNKNDVKQERKAFAVISSNYQELNAKMVNELSLTSLHGGVTGNNRELMWLDFFRSILPKKFSLAQGVIIIDSAGKSSKEVDIAVYDEQYTPYVFQYNTLKLIPIEAVAVVIECKSTGYSKKAVIQWVKSIRKLACVSTGIARTVQGYAIGLSNKSQTSTRPITILASIKKGSPDSEAALKTAYGEYFDFIIQKNADDQQLDVIVLNGGESLGWWGGQLNQYPGPSQAPKTKPQEKPSYLPLEHINNIENIADYNEVEPTYKEEDDGSRGELLGISNTLNDLSIPGNPLLSLNFQLNQLLMLINNPMYFPHFAYASIFKKKLTEAITDAAVPEVAAAASEPKSTPQDGLEGPIK